VNLAPQREDRGFSPVTMVALVIAGAVALAGLGLLTAYAPELRTGNDGRAHALSKSAVGFAGIFRLLKDLGVPVMAARTELGEGAEGSLIVLTPEPGSNIPPALAFEHPGPVLIVLPKWSTVPEAAHPGWVHTVNPAPTRAILRSLPEPFQKNAKVERRRGPSRLQLYRPDGGKMGGAVRIEALQTLSGPQWTPLAVDETGSAILAQRRDSSVYVLADPDLINTQGLKTVAAAALAVDLLAEVRAGDAPVVFDMTLHGLARDRNILRLMIEPPLVGATLVILALIVFAGAQAVARFGPAREPARALALGKAGLADNTAGLIRLARREHRLAEPYALLVRRSAAHAIGAPRGLDDERLNAFLDRVGAASGSNLSYSALLMRAQAAQSPADLVGVARDLHRWKQELIRGRR